MFNLIRRPSSLLLKLDFIRATAKALADGPLYQPLILFFHGVEERLSDLRLQVLHNTLDEFEPLMRHLKRELEIISLDELLVRLPQGRRALRRSVVLTFDDGYQNNATIVTPLMQSLGISFTVYLTTSGIGTRSFIPTFVSRAALFKTTRSSCRLPNIAGDIALTNDAQRARAVNLVSASLKTLPMEQGRELTSALSALLTDSQWSEIEEEFRSELFMTWDEVRQAHSAGAGIASHGHEHYPLNAQQSRAEIRHQLVTSRELITRHIGPCHHFAFPNGQPADICPDALTELEHAGYTTSTTTMPGTINANRSPFLLPRSCVYTVEELQRRVLRSRFDGSARALQAWQTQLIHQAKQLA
jgi:peptidoglycan/xylan/chitin deacetylase (PgdA/CDA1 family)